MTTQIPVAGRTIHFEDSGTGRPLLLLHPFPFDGRYFAPQRSLAARLIAPDMSGAGRSSVPDDPASYSVDGWADEAAAVLDAAGVDRAVVAGVSMGGYVALSLLRRHPERVAALVLANTRASADTPEARERRTAQQERIRREGLSPIVDAMLGAVLPPGSPHAAGVRRMMEAQPAAGVIGILEALKNRPDASGMLGSIRVPVVLVAGSLDAVTPPEIARDLEARIPGARRVEIPGVGHLASFEDPPAFERAIGHLLAG